jgi:hypothetical protein
MSNMSNLCRGNLKGIVVHAYIQSLTYTHGMFRSPQFVGEITDETFYSCLTYLFSAGVASGCHD